MSAELDDLEFPPGSQKRQEEEARLARENSPVAETTVVVEEPGKVPEEVWRGNG
jgi:hypothetical protein